MILQNLLENAVEYGAPATAVTCESVAADSGVDLTLTNRTEDLSPGDLPHVFERFWQKDAARTNGTRSGLGLSIVRGLCDLLGIGVQVDLKQDALFEIRLSFPSEAIR
jgi:signal transduction histidine kinase